MSINKADLAVIILTFNEEVNLPAALESVVGWAKQAFVVDSFSTDETLEIAKEFEAQIYQNPWVDWATQRNWALDNLPIKYEWVLFLDADERVTPELAKEISELLELENVLTDINGFYIRRKFIFLGKWLKHGGFHPNWVLRLVKRHKTRILLAGGWEYFKVEGKVLRLKYFMIHECRKGLSFFIDKHNNYSKLDVKRILAKEKILNGKEHGVILERRRILWLKENFLDKLPLFFRPFFIFTYKYLFKLGFLDGIEGFVYYFLHDFWYPFLIDAKILEMRRKLNK